MAFILGIPVDDVTGTVAEKRIDEVLAMGAKSTQIYKPRQSGVNKNLVHYDKEMIDYASQKCSDLLHFFGYAEIDESLLPAARKSACATPFFKIDSTPDQLAIYNGFKQENVEGFANRLKYQGNQHPQDKIELNVPIHKHNEISMVSQFEVSKYACVNKLFDYELTNPNGE